MKKINLTAAIDAYRAERAAEENEGWAAKFADRWPDDHAAACERLKAARAALAEVCAPIDAEIAAGQKSARTRTITAETVIRFLTDYTDRLNIQKSKMKGITLTADPNAQHFPNAYKYEPESTHFTAEHNGKTWFLTSVYRDTCRATVGTAHLPEDAKSAIIANAEKL